MKKKKILNIFVTMFIASNLMTNFTYANPVNSETEITNLDETDETDETTNNNDPNVADSNDGFNDGSDDIHYDVNKDENGYYIDLIVNTLKNETFNVKLYIYEKEDITLKTLIPISNINVDNLYIDNNHTYVYQFGGQNDYGITLKKYIENKLENGETISSIEKNIVNGKQGVSFIINKNGNYSRTINVIVEKEMNISDGMKFGGQKHPILLENSAINRKTNESDKENILICNCSNYSLW